MRNLEAVDEEARHVATSRMAKLIQAHGMACRQNVLGEILEQTLAIMDQALACVLTTPGGRVYWKASGPFWFNPDHVNKVLQSFEGPSWIEFFDEFERRIGGDA